MSEVFGRIALLIFDGTNRRKFFDKNSVEVYPIGWCEKTDGCLFTPYGPVSFNNCQPTIGAKLNNKLVHISCHFYFDIMTFSRKVIYFFFLFLLLNCQNEMVFSVKYFKCLHQNVPL